MDTKALRQKILDLAIRGKLVPQDPNDEPAEVLLERIREQKQQMFKEGKLKKKDIKNDTIIFKGEDNLHYEKFQDGTVKCIEDEIPFGLPEGWEWERLGNVSTIARGGSPRPIDKFITDDKDAINWIKIGDAEKNGKYIRYTKEKIKPEGLSKTRYVKSGDFLLTNSMSFGRPYILKIDGCIHDGWLVIGNIKVVFNQDFLYYALSSGFMFTTLSLLAAGSTVKNLKSDTVRSVLFPIPPMDEQIRIAQRLEELINMVDVINTDKKALSQIISNVKSKILDLAIRGKIVPQDPNDEPASVLLERIRAEKEELIKQGKIKRDKKESIIFRGDDNSYYERVGDIISNIDDEIPFELPQNWEWSRLQTICYPITDGTHKTPTYSDSGYIFLSAKNITTGKINWNDIMYIPKSLHDELYSRVSPKMNDILLAKNGTTGVAAIVDRECEFDIYVTLALLRVVNNNISSQYLLKIIASDTIQDYFKSSLKGIGVPNLHLEHIRTTLIPIPPINEQNKIAERIYQYYSLLDSIVQNIE